MSRNNLTYKPLENAGMATLIVRIIMIVAASAASILLFLIPSFGFLELMIWNDVVTFVGFIGNILLLVFLFSTFQRMELDQNTHPVSRNKLKLVKISSIILIILISLFIIIYLLAVVLYTELGLITLSSTMLTILMIALVVVEYLTGIFFLIIFIIMSDILGGLEETRNLRFFTKFTLVYGIFWAIYHLIFGTSLIATFLLISNPLIAQILLVVIYSAQIFAGIAGISEVIMAAGLIVISRKLQ